MIHARLDQARKIGNGAVPSFLGGAKAALANTNPLATSAPTFSLGSPVSREPVKGDSWSEAFRAFSKGQVERIRTLSTGENADIILRTLSEGQKQRLYVIEVKVGKRPLVSPAGEIVLLEQIMRDWAFSDGEIARLLGFDFPIDLGSIFQGKQFHRTRDTNDRIRAVIRIAADLDGLYRDLEAIRDWLAEPQRDLGNATPRSLLAEGSMENLLRVKYYVRYLSGR